MNDDYISDDVRDLAERGWSITPEEYSMMRMNSYEREFLLPYVTDETLCQIIERCLHNCERHPKITYDGQLQEVLVPELLERIRNRG